jgi:hypothetical protein
MNELLEDAFNIFITTFYPERSINEKQDSLKNYLLDETVINEIEKKIDLLRNIIQPVQRTPEWYAFRWNLITASNAYKALDSQASINQLIYEKCQPLKIFEDNDSEIKMVNTNTAMHWGQKYEPLSVMIYEDMYNKIKPLLNLKEIDSSDYKKLQDFIILSLTSGYWIPPRRSQDWTELKIKNIDKASDNYIDKNSFVFNKYKTAKFYETQKVDIPKGFKAILTKYLKLNNNEYLITDDKGNKLTNVRLTQKLNHIFGNNISTSMLRHIYLTEKLKDVHKLAELDKLAQDMGHSVSEAMEYVKH